MTNALLNVQEIAKYLGIGKNAAYELVKQTDFPVIKIGARVKTTEALLNDWIARQARKH